ncbi:MAG: hypothetical protein AAF518_22680, partial [Spirochaetota bacterium]
MPTASKPVSNSSVDLFLQREVRGVRIALYTRIVFICLFTVITQRVAQNQFEKSIVFLLCIVALSISLVSLYFLQRTQLLRIIGYIGAISDVIIIGCLQATWYYSVGGETISKAYLLKTSMTEVTFVIMVLQCISLYPGYPLVVCLGG